AARARSRRRREGSTRERAWGRITRAESGYHPSMRVLLLGPDFEDNLSVRYLSSALHEAGIDAELSPFNDAGDIERVVAEARDFDLIGLSICFQVRAQEFLDLVQRLRDDSDPFIVVGGHYATCAAEDLLKHHPAIDVVVMHE